ncbi:MAG: (2Fe-2S)-binding protein [Armatimonadetes bacterium]|nr:(2Fe-2S)-binding protein [Armatimonadota bacterium]
MPAYKFKVNGKDQAVDVMADTPLLWVLRDTLGLCGTKYGCGVGDCGACTVLVDGEAKRSCQITAEEAAGKQVLTIESLPADGTHALQKAWIEEDVPQCGYCQSGQIMAAYALLKETPSPSDHQIDEAMDRNLCRCGTYQRIKAAVKRAAKSGGVA